MEINISEEVEMNKIQEAILQISGSASRLGVDVNKIKIYIPKVDYVRVDTENVEVARIMQKYDLEAIPVVDEAGNITSEEVK